ncbi:hypothetical protein [Myxacorys almedinensis]|uniref:Uncharacterized protein n=1 Tax=Myxacorys almedinensis A TaxID=2690445 RepID=A0A8J8CK89_9CYAN|nr:hypothetical protein [Myxacorys almedinensis]NDJ19608.1 hypothetical protein [Myxacorys almedinensis A]
MKRQMFAINLAATTFSIVSTAILLTASPASAGEVMTDRCSSEVAIVPSYNAQPMTPGTVLLTRDANGQTPWSNPFRVKTGGGGLTGSGYIRWWCHSTTGNIFDPGTWRPDIDFAKAGVCVVDGIGVIFGGDENDKGGKKGSDIVKNCLGAVKKIGSSAKDGWTPERSRCGNRSTLIRARLGSNRLLQIECLGK